MKNQWFNKADFLQTLFDTIPSLLFIVDRDLTISHLNAAAMTFAEGGAKAPVPRRSGDFLHCLHSFETPAGCGGAASCRTCVIRRSVGEAFQGKHIHRETTKLSLIKEGVPAEVHFLVTTQPVHYEGREFVLVVMEDISEQKKFEEALRRHAARLEAANRDMESFSYSASHDLRSPLVAISGFTRILLEDHGGKFDEKARELLGIIAKNAARMEQLLADLLKFSRLSTKEIRLHEMKIDMAALVKEAFEELETGAKKRKITMKIKPLPEASGDRPMLKQVFVNLLSNALKYTGRTEEARIEVGGYEEGDENIYYVKDNGVGFDMKYDEKLFGLFSRLHSDKDFEGTGIGLVIVKRIIQKHGGRVWAEGRPNEGAVFYFSLPASREPLASLSVPLSPLDPASL